jgi:hypothetical protein
VRRPQGRGPPGRPAEHRHWHEVAEPRRGRRSGAVTVGWWDALEVQAGEGAFWLLLDLEERTATWLRAPYDPAPARARARALGLDDTFLPAEAR